MILVPLQWQGLLFEARLASRWEQVEKAYLVWLIRRYVTSSCLC